MLQQNLRLSIAFVVECFLYAHHCYRKYSDYLDESAEDFSIFSIYFIFNVRRYSFCSGVIL